MTDLGVKMTWRHFRGSLLRQQPPALLWGFQKQMLYQLFNHHIRSNARFMTQSDVHLKAC